MNCNITATPDFARELKHLAKRYPSIKNDYKNFLDKLAQNPLMGSKLGQPDQINITDKELRQLMKRNGLA